MVPRRERALRLRGRDPQRRHERDRAHPGRRRAVVRARSRTDLGRAREARCRDGAGGAGPHRRRSARDRGPPGLGSGGAPLPSPRLRAWRPRSDRPAGSPRAFPWGPGWPPASGPGPAWPPASAQASGPAWARASRPASERRRRLRAAGRMPFGGAGFRRLPNAAADRLQQRVPARLRAGRRHHELARPREELRALGLGRVALEEVADHHRVLAAVVVERSGGRPGGAACLRLGLS